MFGRRRVATASNLPAPSADARQSRNVTAPVPHPQDTARQFRSSPPIPFDFELDGPPSALPLANNQRQDERFERPQNDGHMFGEDRRRIVSVGPPVLPPIPRVASRYDKDYRPALTEASYRGVDRAPPRARYNEKEQWPTNGHIPTQRPLSFEKPFHSQSFSRPGSTTGFALHEAREPARQFSSPETALRSRRDVYTGAEQTVAMSQRVDLPPPSPRQELPTIAVGPIMNRSRADSNTDQRSFSQDWLPPRMPGLATQSTPDLISTLYPTIPSGAPAADVPKSPRSPLSAFSRTPGVDWAKIQSSTTLPNLLHKRTRNPRISEPSQPRQGSNSSKSQDLSSSHSSTIGTSYDETSLSYPLPHHVITRPKTDGTTASLGGVSVPTHHTTAAVPRPEQIKVEKSEKRKTRLLSPFALLAKRRNAQEDESAVKERAAQEQALARQKDVATVGISKLPEDFDPRIKGKVVHDFSAPRLPKRGHSQGENDWNGSDRHLAGSNSGPNIAPLKEREPPAASPKIGLSDPPRRTSHVPVFVEHLAENPEHVKRLSSIQAERLENKDFLQRASYVSSTSALSQESFSLPPFARRSQQMDPGYSAGLHDQDSKRSSERSGRNERDSSPSAVSPPTNRNSPVQDQTSRHSASSPISVSSSARSAHASPGSPGRGLSPNKLDRGMRVDTVATSSSLHHPPAISEQPASEQGEDFTAHRPESNHSDEDVTAIPPRSSLRDLPRPKSGLVEDETAPRSLQSGIQQQQQQQEQSILTELLVPPRINALVETPLPSPNSFASSQDSPVLRTAEISAAPVRVQPATARLVEREGSSKSHKKSSSRGIKHHASNASRFSFQLGGNSAEEHLEDKHRKMAGPDDASTDDRPISPDEDDDDYFDEDAMDDMDEMEVEASAIHAGLPEITAMASPNTLMTLAQARAQLQSDSDSESEDEGFANRALSTSQNGTNTSNATNALSSSFGQYGIRSTSSPHPEQPSSRHTAGMAPTTPHQAISGPQRDSGNSERKRISSGQSLTSSEMNSLNKNSPNGSSGARTLEDSAIDPAMIGKGKQPTFMPTTQTSGIGLGLSAAYDGYTSSGAPEPTRPTPGQQRTAEHQRNTTADSTELRTGNLGNGGLNQKGPGQPLRYDGHDDDEMYFDDGGFGADVDTRELGDTMDENQFDDDSFLARDAPRYVRPTHGGTRHSNGGQRDSSGMLPTDGPYPSFAMPNPVKAKQRDSQMLLEDLPLHNTLPGNNLIPQRNPFEDAKRLGLSDKVPPLPPPPGNLAAMQQISANLNQYHAALAEAANKAAAEGRFYRIPSSSTTRSLSVNSSLLPEGVRATPVGDGDSFRSGDDGLDRSTSGGMLPSHSDQMILSSPPRMNFDFGFEDHPSLMPEDLFSSVTQGVLEEDEFDDADMIAAANSEALASDDEGFYGQEFGFYARARPTASGGVYSTNGGFFGEDGDDGLTRNKSLKEPNLTPITERSEFSTRNSFIGPGGSFGPPSAGAHRRLSVSPLFEGEVTSFEELRRLRASAFGGSTSSLHSDGTRGSPRSAGSHLPFPTPFGNVSANAIGGEPMSAGYSTGSSGSSNPPSAAPIPTLRTVAASPDPNQHPSSPPADIEATPRRPLPSSSSPSATPTRKPVVPSVPRIQTFSHSRKSSGGTGDSVTYVREPQENGPPRWVMERRRTSEQGQLELVGREVVQGGWI